MDSTPDSGYSTPGSLNSAPDSVDSTQGSVDSTPGHMISVGHEAEKVLLKITQISRDILSDHNVSILSLSRDKPPLIHPTET